jgi:hypothetical protein
MRELARKTRYSGRVSLVFVLAVGYGSEDPEQRSLEIGAHGGQGQIASVLRGCSGQALHSEKSVFNNTSLSGSVNIPVSDNAYAKIGVRIGKWSANARFARRIAPDTYGSTDPVYISFTYYNPSISYESEKVGIGVGFIDGDIPVAFDRYNKSGYHDEVDISGHLRFGRLRGSHFIMSVAEGEPLFANGGVFDIGVGYTMGKSGRYYSGLSIGFYDRPGFLQRGRLKIGERLDLELAGRIGRAGNTFEAAFSGGLVFTIGAGKSRTARDK